MPWTAAITGFSQSRIELTVPIAPRVIMRRVSPTTRSGWPSGSSTAARWVRRSAPVQKNRPVAAITTQRIAWSSFARSIHSANCLRCSWVTAFPISGRFSVTRRMPSSTAKMISSLSLMQVRLRVAGLRWVA